jgi:hypothetical protein
MENGKKHIFEMSEEEYGNLDDHYQSDIDKKRLIIERKL